MIALGQLRKKKFRIFLIRHSKEILYIFLIILGSLKIGASLRNPAVIFYVLYNNFFYVLLSFVFHLQKDFYGVHDNTDGPRLISYFFFYRKISISFTSLFSPETTVIILISNYLTLRYMIHASFMNYLKSLLIT